MLCGKDASHRARKSSKTLQLNGERRVVGVMPPRLILLCVHAGNRVDFVRRVPITAKTNEWKHSGLGP